MITSTVGKISLFVGQIQCFYLAKKVNPPRKSKFASYSLVGSQPVLTAEFKPTLCLTLQVTAVLQVTTVKSITLG